MSKNFPPASQRNASIAVNALVLLSVLLASGCASVGAPQQSRTLSAFDELQIQPDGSRAWRTAQPGRYEAVHVDTAAIAFGSDVQLDGEQREELRAALSSALTERFASAGLQAAKASDGRRAVVVRATVTAVELTSPTLNVATTLLLLAPLSRGGLTVEIEAVDAAGGQRVAALAFAGKAGLENIASAYSSTGHAKLQADVVAERFVALFAGNAIAAAPAR
jgi:Protein of unknown function (DUF3313)